MSSLVGKGSTSTVWHIIRRPYSNEGGPNMDRENHLMSLCSHVWTITKTKRGAPDCFICLQKLKVIKRKARYIRREALALDPNHLKTEGDRPSSWVKKIRSYSGLSADQRRPEHHSAPRQKDLMGESSDARHQVM